MNHILRVPTSSMLILFQQFGFALEVLPPCCSHS